MPLPKGYTEYIHHVGNASELNSIIRNGLIPGRRCLKRGRQAVFFTSVNPMDDGYGMGETPRDLTKPRIAPYKNTGTRFQNTIFCCNAELAQEKGLQFYQTRSHAVVLYNTLLAACIEKAVCMKTQDELYQKVRFYKARTQDPLGNHQAIRNVTGKLATTSWITKYLEYLFLQSTAENNTREQGQEVDREVREPQA